MLRLASIVESPTHLIYTLERYHWRILEVSRPDLGPSAQYLRHLWPARQPRGSSTARFRFPPMSTPLVSPPHWSISRVIDHITIEAQSCHNRSRYTSHTNHHTSFDPLPLGASSSSLTVSSQSSHLKINHLSSIYIRDGTWLDH